MDSDQLQRTLQMLLQIQALSNDPDAAGLVQSGAQLATVLELVIQLQSMARVIPMQRELDSDLSRIGAPPGFAPLSLFLPLLFQQGASASSQRPLNERTLSRLPEMLITSSTLERLRSSGSETLCTICQEDYVVGKHLMKLPCEHVFCADCGRQWLRRSNTCPVCRSEVQDEDLADNSRDWHSEDLFSFRYPQGSPLEAVRRAREAQNGGATELWPPVDDMARVAEQHSVYPRVREENPTAETRDLSENVHRLATASPIEDVHSTQSRGDGSSSPSLNMMATSPDRISSVDMRETPPQGRQERQTLRNVLASRRQQSVPTANSFRTTAGTNERHRSSTGQGRLLSPLAHVRRASASSLSSSSRIARSRSEAATTTTRGIGSNIRQALTTVVQTRDVRRPRATGPR